jgi:hypothetical protein
MYKTIEGKVVDGVPYDKHSTVIKLGGTKKKNKIQIQALKQVQGSVEKGVNYLVDKAFDLPRYVDEKFLKLKGKAISKVDKLEELLKDLPQTVNNAVDYAAKPQFANLGIMISKLITDVWDSIKRFIDAVIYQLNKVYGDNFSYYELFMIIFFITLLLIVCIILYWDNIYRTAKKLSHCSQVGMIAYENRDIDKHPFVYVIMIINESNLDGVLDKYVLKLEYNFIKKTTNAILGETEYVNEVMISDSIESEKYKSMVDAEYNYNTAASTDLDTKKKLLDNAKVELSAALSQYQFSYFDLGRMQSKKLENINKGLISDKKYKYICMTPDNRILKTEAARELAAFVRDFGANNKTSIYPISKMLNAMEQSRQ